MVLVRKAKWPWQKTVVRQLGSGRKQCHEYHNINKYLDGMFEKLLAIVQPDIPLQSWEECHNSTRGTIDNFKCYIIHGPHSPVNEGDIEELALEFKDRATTEIKDPKIAEIIREGNVEELQMRFHTWFAESLGKVGMEPVT